MDSARGLASQHTWKVSRTRKGLLVKKKKIGKMHLAKETLLHLQGGSDEDTTDGRTMTACTPGCMDTYTDIGGACKYPVRSG